MEEQIVKYFGENEIKKSPMYSSEGSEVEEASSYESPLVFVETCIADYPNEIKLDDELSMCRLAMFLHLDCKRFEILIYNRLFNGHLDFLYVEIEKFLAQYDLKRQDHFINDLQQIAFFLHMLQFSPERALEYGNTHSYLDHYIVPKIWVCTYFPIFELYYKTMKSENKFFNIEQSTLLECIGHFPIDFAPYILEVFEKDIEMVIETLMNLRSNDVDDDGLISNQKHDLKKQYFEKIILHYIRMNDEKFDMCFANRQNDRRPFNPSTSFVIEMRVKYPHLYDEFNLKIQDKRDRLKRLDMLFPRPISVNRDYRYVPPNLEM